MITSELIRKVRRIQILTSHQADALLAGGYPTAFKGQGLEFEEVRPYQLGDDVRTIDWNVTARRDSPHVKVYREERELTIHFLADVSGSLAFGTQDQFKRELAAEIVALLGFAAIRNHDRVGAGLFTDHVERTVTPRHGVRHVLRILRDLLIHEPSSRATDLAAVLDHFNRTIKRRAVIFLLSDFFDSGYEDALCMMRRRHDVVAIVLRDRREHDLPRMGLLRIVDPESGRFRVLDTSSRRQRLEYSSKARAWMAQRRELFRRAKIDSVELFTGEDPVPPLRALFARRITRHE